MTYTTVSHCGNDHLMWTKSMDFYDQDIDTLESRLVEIVKKNNVQEAMAGVEHFQNQFIVQRNNIDEIRHNINVHTGKVARDAQEHAGKMESVLDEEHDSIRDQFENFERVMNALRHEFNRFMAKWM